MKKLFVVMITVCFIALTTVVFAAPTDQTPSVVAPARHQGYAGLQLSKDQIDKMHAIKTRYRQETRDMRYELEQKQLEMRKLFTDPKTDDATLLAKAKELNAVELKLMDKMAEMKIERRKVFTPEQLQKLDRPRMGGRHGHCR
jgi:Spy/CpxP family protein refolding chaperone